MEAAHMSSGHFCFLCISFIAIVMVTFEPLAQAQENKVEVESTVRSQIMDLERQVYDAAKKRDATSVRNLLADDSLDVGENGIWGKERSAQSISSHEKHPGIELTAYSLSDWQFRKASDDVIVVAYKASLTSTSNGKQLPLRVEYVSEVWVRRANTWLNLLFHNTPEAPKMVRK
jgi:hypothetical protein